MNCRYLSALALLVSWTAGFAQPTNGLATNSPAVAESSSVTNDPVEIEYEKLLELDDVAAQEIDGWIIENRKFEEEGGGVPAEELIARIDKRRESVRQAYEEFVKQHPNHGRARLAYASFLEDAHDLAGALHQLLKAKEVEPSNPAAWNNLANYYGHYGDVTNAFSHYEKAIELDPTEPVYYQNFGTTVFLFRKDVREYYHITEQQVFDKALALYSNSLALDPNNFLLATDIAMTYYGIKPPRNEEAAKAWNYALNLAEGSLQREGVLIHLGRIALNAGEYAKARAYLNSVTNSELFELRDRVMRNLNDKENPGSGDAPEAESGKAANQTSDSVKPDASQP